MKNLILVFVFLCFLACQKQNDVAPAVSIHSATVTGEVIFYSPDTVWDWGVRVDTIEYGPVVRSLVAPQCGDTAFENLTLPVGRHIVSVYSLSGLFDQYPDTIDVMPGACLSIAVQYE